jgi:hypothetical protein
MSLAHFLVIVCLRFNSSDYKRLVFNLDCGPQGVKTSSFSKTSEKQVDVLRSQYSEKTSVVRSTNSRAGKFIRIEAEFGEFLYEGEIYQVVDTSTNRNEYQESSWV